jgi:hypothetical protein
MTAQSILNDYFANHWHRKNGDIAKFNKTGLSLANKINYTDRVLDVGCGRNLFKGLIPNLVGIDPAFDEADVKCTIEEFDAHELFDVAFCLGIINFGGAEQIEQQIAKIVKLLKPSARIYWRCNPGQQDHNNEECKAINFYPWSIEEHIRLADMFGFSLAECSWDTTNRIYAEWKRV